MTLPPELRARVPIGIRRCEAAIIVNSDGSATICIRNPDNTESEWMLVALYPTIWEPGAPMPEGTLPERLDGLPSLPIDVDTLEQQINEYTKED